MMEKRKKLYIALLALGLCLLGLWLAVNDALPKSAAGALIGVGSGMFAMGLANLAVLRWEKQDPQQMKRNEIEAADERNVAIRRRAQAVSGEVLQWLVMAAAWLSIALDGPLWVTLAAMAVFVGKTVLELALMSRYQREM